MKIKEGFIVREISGQSVAMAVGKASKEFHGMIKLNDTGLFIWKQLENDTDEASVVRALTDKYDVDTERACSEAHKFIEVLRSAGFIEE